MKNNQPDIEFVSYDGEYPCLCYGKLTLKINGKKMNFCSINGAKYPSFWSSGGKVSFDNDWNPNVTRGEWEWFCENENKLPKEIIDNKEYVMELFNDNVQWGCCGGCI